MGRALYKMLVFKHNCGWSDYYCLYSAGEIACHVPRRLETGTPPYLYYRRNKFCRILQSFAIPTAVVA